MARPFQTQQTTQKTLSHGNMEHNATGSTSRQHRPRSETGRPNRHLGGTQLEIVTLSDTKLGTNVTLETQSQSQPKWTIISRGRVAIALNEKWTAAWRNHGIVVNTDTKGAQCRSMLIQIPCFQKLGLSVIATYALAQTQQWTNNRSI